MNTRRASTFGMAALVAASMVSPLLAGSAKGSGKKAGGAAPRIHFTHADQDSNGRISAKELKAERQFTQAKRAEVDTKWEVKADKNDDGSVSKGEYRHAKTQQYLKNEAEVDKKWEAKADDNSDGSVSRGELNSFHTTRMDKDGDGAVSKEEQKRYWQHKKARANTDREKGFDADGNGYISGDEARAMLQARLRVINTQGRAKVDNELEREFDGNGDGYIDRTEAILMRKAVA